ncbi:MAG: DUF87 domain-containing protein, partial [Hydrogenothermaceae bacterium]|nr:DUF87 domain-containing protein [Hydrogenothermaceae bacterium]
MLDYFNDIKEQHSFRLSDDLVGFALNPVRLREFEFLLLDEELPALSYVEVKHDKKTRYIGRVNGIYAYDLGFFANPFRNRDDGVTASAQDFRKILSQDLEGSWRKAALLAYFSDNKSPLRIASAEVVCVVREDFPKTPEHPFDAGLPVYRASEETLRKAFIYRKETMPVVIGRLKGTDVSATIDLAEVLKRHVMVTGVTGAGKSHFVKNLIKATLSTYPEVQIIVFDPHGEYSE